MPPTSRKRSRARAAGLLLATLAAPAAAQNSGQLSRVIPELYGPDGLIVDSLAPLPSGQTHSAHFNSAFQSQFTQFNIALASQVASVPIPSPSSGFSYRFDPSSGVFVRSTNSFGTIFTERATTVGRHKLSFGFNYQHFSFDQVEGIDLDAVPAVFTHDNPEPGGKADVVTTTNRIDASVDQFTPSFTIGVTDRIDLTLAAPMIRAELDVASDAVIRRVGTTDPRVHFFDAAGGLGNTQTFHNGGSAGGIGDVHVLVKGSLYRDEGSALALGMDMRFPSGDELELLGTGAVGLRPFVAMSSIGKLFSAHVNVGYLWNGDSVLAGDVETGEKGDLPDRFLYAGAVDFGVHDRVTLNLELLGSVLFDSPRLLRDEFQALDGRSTFADIAFDESTISETNVAAGIKLNLADRLLVSFSATVAVDDGGLRDRFTPLVGAEYSF